MIRKRSGGPLFATVLLVSSSMFAVPNVAAAAPAASDDGGRSVDAVVDPTVNGDLFETSKQLEEAGILGARSELASLIADSKMADDGALELVYFAGDARASTLLKLIETVNASAPLDVRAVPTATDPVKLNSLAQQVSLGDEDTLKALGVSSVSGVRADTERGVLVVSSPDRVASYSTDSMTIEGFPVEFEVNINVQV